MADCKNYTMEVAGLTDWQCRLSKHRYIAQVDQHSPACRTLEGGGPMPADGDATQPPSSHQKLLHK